MTLFEEVTKQFNEEVGNLTLSEEAKAALQMKYGLIAATLTQSELNLLMREERKNG